ncbi:hypothetical protein MC885_018029 [Smutsia gigantea]|nr:hypothetical protein MC885_018029 [Smutsia gigantea]
MYQARLVSVGARALERWRGSRIKRPLKTQLLTLLCLCHGPSVFHLPRAALSPTPLPLLLLVLKECLSAQPRSKAQLSPSTKRKREVSPLGARTRGQQRLEEAPGKKAKR